jgi:YesN/AraC family two-component response regulator
MESKVNPVQSLSILLVEDEELDREILATALTSRFPGIALHTAMDGKTGLELFKKFTPDIVVTDINMPEIGGFQLAVNIRSLRPATKLIVLTGCTGDGAMGDTVAKDFAIDHFILKPVAFQELYAIIDQCIAAIAQGKESQIKCEP